MDTRWPYSESPKMPASMRALILAVLFSLLLAPAVLPPEVSCGEVAEPLIVAERWDEAGKIFRSDPRWLGGDGATSVDLGHGRVLWLFGDSFIDPTCSGSRRTDDLVRNSIAIQTGYDPSSASMRFFWKMKDGRPAAFFDGRGDRWYWPASGIMAGKHLLLFLMEVRPDSNELGFEACGWKAVWVENPHDEPDLWSLAYLKSPQRSPIVVGSGNPLFTGGFLQVFAADPGDRSVYLVRWPERDARTGTLTSPQWWTGRRAGWVGTGASGAKPCRVMKDGQMEFTVEYRPDLKRYLQVQTLSVLDPCLAVSASASTTGPWDARTCFYHPPDRHVPGRLIYAGKSHPMLKGADMVFSYVVNSTSEKHVLGDMTIYFPVMLRGRVMTGRPCR